MNKSGKFDVTLPTAVWDVINLVRLVCDELFTRGVTLGGVGDESPKRMKMRDATLLVGDKGKAVTLWYPGSGYAHAVASPIPRTVFGTDWQLESLRLTVIVMGATRVNLALNEGELNQIVELALFRRYKKAFRGYSETLRRAEQSSQSIVDRLKKCMEHFVLVGEVSS